MERKIESTLVKRWGITHRCVPLFLLFLFAFAMQESAYSQGTEDIPLTNPGQMEGPSGSLPVPQSDQKPKSAGLPTNVIEIFLSLNYWILPFGLATLISIWFTTERIVVLRRGRVIPKPFVQRFLKLLGEGELEKDEALQICEENGSPVAMVFAHGVRKWGKPSVEVEQAIIDGGERQVSSLRRHLQVINGVATVTPLIGLLGTVWGMLDSFNSIAIEGAMGNTEQLASGIALALVTTAAGLIVAIPSLIIYMYLSGRVDALVMRMDDLAQKVVFSISAEGLVDIQQRPRKMSTAKQRAKKSAG